MTLICKGRFLVTLPELAVMVAFEVPVFADELAERVGTLEHGAEHDVVDQVAFTFAGTPEMLN